MNTIRLFPIIVVITGIVGAQGAVVLVSPTTPSSGQAGVTTINAVGSGFPTGTIPAANVTVELRPSVAGSGPNANVPASNVVTLSGTNRRVVFRIPVGINVTTPTNYNVFISGTTSTGTAFKSSNSALLSITPAASLGPLSPNSGNAGLAVSVLITGINTNFVQGTTQASFGDGISVGGGTAGGLGPVTVTSPTTATAALSIPTDATVGPTTVQVTTGVQSATLSNGFTVLAPLTTIDVNTASTLALPKGFSGFNLPQLLNGVEYFDPKFVAAVQPMKPGFIRFPAGTGSLAYDWQAGKTNTTWLNSLVSGNPPLVDPVTASILRRGQKLTQAKGGVFLSDFATFANTFGADGVICFNTFTDNNTGSAFTMVNTTKTLNLNVREWDLGNEPYFFHNIFPTASNYAQSSFPYFVGMSTADPTAKISADFAGVYPGIAGNFAPWDNGLSAFKPRYWNSVTIHLYPITTTLTADDERMTLNGILSTGIPQYLTGYLPPIIGSTTPFTINEFNSDGIGTNSFQGSIYNGVFLAEAVARISTVPNVQGVGVHALYYGNAGYFGMILAANDYESYLIARVTANPNFSTNTATDPNTQFQFFYSAPGLAMQVVNEAINSSTHTWPTTVSFSPTVPILGFDGQPIPAVFAQGYDGDNGKRYLVVTNKSDSAVPVNLTSGGVSIAGPVTIAAVSNADFQAANTPTSQTNVQITTGTSANPVTIGPNSVTRIEW